MKYTKAYIVSKGRYVLLTCDTGHVADLYSVMREQPHELQYTLPLSNPDFKWRKWNIAMTTGGYKASYTVHDLMRCAKAVVDLTAGATKANRFTDPASFADIVKLARFGIVTLGNSTKANECLSATAPAPASNGVQKCWVLGTVGQDGSISFASNPKQHLDKVSAEKEAVRIASLPDLVKRKRTVLVFESVFGAVKTSVSTFNL